jgi:hypothetical protein
VRSGTYNSIPHVATAIKLFHITSILSVVVKTLFQSILLKKALRPLKSAFLKSRIIAVGGSGSIADLQ